MTGAYEAFRQLFMDLQQRHRLLHSVRSVIGPDMAGESCRPLTSRRDSF